MASQTTLTETESPAHMDNESKDKVCTVMYKLAALDDFFSFYRVVHDKMSLRGESISGLSFFIPFGVNTPPLGAVKKQVKR